MYVPVHVYSVRQMGHEHEVFPNAPLVYVACEIRFPLVPSLRGDATLDLLVQAFADQLPIPTVTTMDWADDDPAVGDWPERLFRFLSRDRTTSVAVTRTSLSVETTSYTEWKDFRSLVMHAMRVVRSCANVAGVERVGLRYIDEIRVPDPVPDAAGWGGWVNDEVLRHLNATTDMSPTAFTTATSYGSGNNHMLVRFAALNGDGVVSDEPLQRLSVSPNGPFFVIDVDSFQDTSGEAMLDFAAEHVASVLDELHEPIGVLFQRTITDRARNLFRKAP